MVENLAAIIGIEALAAAQGVELRAPLATSHALQTHISDIRKVSARLENDRQISPDIQAAANLVTEGGLLPKDAPTLD